MLDFTSSVEEARTLDRVPSLPFPPSTNSAPPVRSPVVSPEVTRVFIRPTVVRARGQAYAVSLEDGTSLITETRSPVYDACRALGSRGVSGRMEVWDDHRPYPRVLIKDVERAARLAAVETEDGPRSCRYRPFGGIPSPA